MPLPVTTHRFHVGPIRHYIRDRSYVFKFMRVGPRGEIEWCVRLHGDNIFQDTMDDILWEDAADWNDAHGIDGTRTLPVYLGDDHISIDQEPYNHGTIERLPFEDVIQLCTSYAWLVLDHYAGWPDFLPDDEMRLVWISAQRFINHLFNLLGPGRIVHIDGLGIHIDNVLAPVWFSDPTGPWARQHGPGFYREFVAAGGAAGAHHNTVRQGRLPIGQQGVNLGPMNNQKMGGYAAQPGAPAPAPVNRAANFAAGGAPAMQTAPVPAPVRIPPPPAATPAPAPAPAFAPHGQFNAGGWDDDDFGPANPRFADVLRPLSPRSYAHVGFGMPMGHFGGRYGPPQPGRYGGFGGPAYGGYHGTPGPGHAPIQAPAPASTPAPAPVTPAPAPAPAPAPVPATVNANTNPPPPASAAGPSSGTPTGAPPAYERGNNYPQEKRGWH